jgi:nitrite reductase/ring-hydroxylating ferredoxin subunit/uncharacterized membrane protein
MNTTEEMFAQIPGFEEAAHTVAHTVHDGVLSGGEPVREATDVLHGKWLGHPVHPALTDLVIGAWAFGSVLDMVSMGSRSRRIADAADLLISAGNALAIPTAMAGLADYSTAPPNAIQTGAAHAVLNTGGLLLNLASAGLRKSGNRGAGVALSTIASGVLMVSAYLGGRLTYHHKVGVNKIPEVEHNDSWTPVMPESDLPEKTPKRVEVDQVPVVVYRTEGKTHAMCAVCGHEGGPLDEGEFQGTHVTCPWHQSVYDLRDGSVVHGPTVYPEPVYEVQSQNGMIELK